MKKIALLLVTTASLAVAAMPGAAQSRGGGLGSMHGGVHSGGHFSGGGGNWHGGSGGFHGGGNWRGSDHWRGGGWHRGGFHSSFGLVIGAPFFWGSPYLWGAPYPYYPSYYPDYSPTVVYAEPPAPVTYVERGALAPSDGVPLAPASSYWYYCADKGYYPYIQSCPTGWLRVIPDNAPPSR